MVETSVCNNKFQRAVFKLKQNTKKMRPEQLPGINHHDQYQHHRHHNHFSKKLHKMQISLCVVKELLNIFKKGALK